MKAIARAISFACTLVFWCYLPWEATAADFFVAAKINASFASPSDNSTENSHLKLHPADQRKKEEEVANGRSAMSL